MTVAAGRSLRDRLRALPVLTTAPAPLDPRALPDSPQELFVSWLDDAIEGGQSEPHTMTLATADAQGRPNARVLTLKDVDELGWWFAGRESSPSTGELRANPHAALACYWPACGRQVRVRGTVEYADAATSAADFAARSPHARAVVLAARDLDRTGRDWTRADLAAAVADLLAAGPGDHVVPTGEPVWLAFAIRPEQVEFWQADPGRLHQRIRYTVGDDGWSHAELGR